jgi:hypothetical protein
MIVIGCRHELGAQAHSLSHEAFRYLGLMEIQRNESDPDYCLVLGLASTPRR